MKRVADWRLRAVYVRYFMQARAITISLNFEPSLANMTISGDFVRDRLRIGFVENEEPFLIYMAQVSESTVTIRIGSSQEITLGFTRKTPIRFLSKISGEERVIDDYDYRVIG